MQVSTWQTVRHAATAGLALALVAASHASVQAQPRVSASVRQSVTLIRQGEPTRALQQLEAAIKADPNAADALATKAWLHATSSDPKVRSPEKAITDAATAVQISNYKQRGGRAAMEGLTRWTLDQRVANLYVAALAYGSAGNYTQAIGHAIYAVEAARRLNVTHPSPQAKELLAASEATLRRIQETDKVASEAAMNGIAGACTVTASDDVMGRPVEFTGIAPVPQVSSRQ